MYATVLVVEDGEDEAGELAGGEYGKYPYVGNAEYVGKPVVPQKQVDGICVTVTVEIDTEVIVTQAEELDIAGGMDEVIFGVGVTEDGGADVVFAVVGTV